MGRRPSMPWQAEARGHHSGPFLRDSHGSSSTSSHVDQCAFTGSTWPCADRSRRQSRPVGTEATDLPQGRPPRQEPSARRPRHYSRPTRQLDLPSSHSPREHVEDPEYRQAVRLFCVRTDHLQFRCTRVIRVLDPQLQRSPDVSPLPAQRLSDSTVDDRDKPRSLPGENLGCGGLSDPTNTAQLAICLLDWPISSKELHSLWVLEGQVIRNLSKQGLKLLRVHDQQSRDDTG